MGLRGALRKFYRNSLGRSLEGLQAVRALEGIHRGLGGRKAFPGPGPQAVTGFLFWPPASGQGPHPREAQSLALCPWKGGPWVVAGVGGGAERSGGARGTLCAEKAGPWHPGARTAAAVCQPPCGAQPGACRPLHLPDRPLF